MSSARKISECLSGCRPTVDYCFSRCESLYNPDGTSPSITELQKCYDRCSDIISNCNTDCYNIPSYGLELMGKCVSSDISHTSTDQAKACFKERCVGSQDCETPQEFLDLYINRNAYSDLQKKAEENLKSHLSEFANIRSSHKYSYVLLFSAIILGLISIFRSRFNRK